MTRPTTDPRTLPGWMLGMSDAWTDADHEAIGWSDHLLRASSSDEARDAVEQVAHWSTIERRLRPVAAVVVHRLLSRVRDTSDAALAGVLDAVTRLCFEFCTEEIETHCKVAIVLCASDVMTIEPSRLDPTSSIDYLDLLSEIARNSSALREPAVRLARELADHESERVRALVNVFEKNLEPTRYVELDLE